MPLTEEQLAVVQSRSEALKVVAFAGAGKTSTLMAYAKVRPERRMLYLAFNNSIAQEAARKFTRNVTCLTTHSLAYRITGISFRHKLEKNTIRANQAAQALGLNPVISSDLGLANQSLRALKHFLSTSCVDIEEFALSVAEEGRHKTDAFQGAARLWQAMCDPRNDVMPMLHDGYLKLFQLSAPKLNYDTILFDEAQDANPVTLAIVRQQSCAKIFVGDPHQQIYQFRYAENAMDDPLLNDELFLTESFRFGKEVADAANRLLAVKRERNRIIGGRKVESSSTKACIARGNAFLYKRSALLAQQGGTICWVGGIDGYRLNFLQDMWYLKAERHADIKDRFVAGFQDFDALRGYATAQDERDLTAWIRVIDGHSRWQAIPEEIALVRSRSVDQPQGASLSLSTAHKSKGLEFGSVELADDFPEAELANPVKYSRESHPIFWDNQGFRGGMLLPLEEVNLRYVAITRAEATCTSGQWPSPMFSALADYVRRHPRFLTLEEATALGSGIQSTSHPAIQENQAVFLPAEISSNGKIRVYELARDMSLDNKEVLDAAIQLGIAVKSYSSSLSDNDSTRICIWLRDKAARIHNAINDIEIPLQTNFDVHGRELWVHDGMDNSQTSKRESRTVPQAQNALNMASVVSAYEQRYPVLHWQFLAQCWQQGTSDVEALLNGHPLQSAGTLVKAFVDALALTLIDDSPKAPVKSGGDSGLLLSALISDHHGLSPVDMDERYISYGWTEAGGVPIPCPYCASKPTVAYYRPRDDKNQSYEQWYRQNWALFCTNCAVLSAPRNPELLRVEWNRGTFRKTSR
jgi:hypothetical protein